MRNRSYCNRVWQRHTTSRPSIVLLAIVIWVSVLADRVAASSDAPLWMHSAANAKLPAYDEKTDAVSLYSEENVTVLSADKIRIHVRQAYKILRPHGREHGTAVVYSNPTRKVTSLHGWCIPAQGRDYEVKDKDAIEVSLPSVEGSELVSDVRARVLRIPAPDPGNVVGYEFEVEEQPMVLQDTWHFQGTDPRHEAHFSLQLPAGWEYKAAWVNYPEVKPSQAGNNQWQWVVNDVNEIRVEEDMPPMSGISGQMTVSFFPPGGQLSKSFGNWRDMGNWYLGLVNGRREATPEIKQQIATLTASAHTSLEKMNGLARFVQHDVRYVAIELGIGGWQPHAAPEVFTHRYGDCKDKATLMSTMLKEIGVESYYVVINARRGVAAPGMPSHNVFNHMILAIKLPEGVSDPSLIATLQHPKLGKILFFDPTNEMTPFGELAGHLQANYGLLVAPDGGELVQLPQEPGSMNSIQRTASLKLEPTGTLKGEVKEVRLGDRAAGERRSLRTVSKAEDQIKPIESLLASSLMNFQITQAQLVNLHHTNLPFGFNYSFQSENYAKNAAGLMLVRPRVLGTKAAGFLETKEPRKYPVEFDGPARDNDTFDITMPSGYVVEDVPPPVDSDFSFASYHSKTEVKGPVIHYTRTFEVKELSVPVEKAEDLKRFYRIVANDERNTVVLRLAGQ